MNKEIKSFWGVNLKADVIENNSDTLAVILPGIGYTLDRVTLEYSVELALSKGYDVLKIEYGFQKARAPFDATEEFNVIANESLELLNIALEKGYKNIVIIAKSIGTCVQTVLNEHLNDYNVKNVTISPINKTIDMGIIKGSLVFTGTSDPLLSRENLDKITDVEGVTLVKFKNANHALNIDKEPLKSLDIEKNIIIHMNEFLD